MIRPSTLAIILVAVGCFGIAAAQGSARRLQGNGATVPSPAPISNSGFDAVKMNGIQEALFGRFVGLQDLYLRKADGLSSSKQDEVRGKVIVRVNYYVRGMLDKEQQTMLETHVWQVDRYRPGGEWARVLVGPVLVNAILKCTPAQQKAIDALFAENHKKMNEVFREVGLPPRGQQWDQGQRAEVSRRGAELDKQLHDGVYKLLSAAQRKEYDSLIKGLKSELEALF